MRRASWVPCLPLLALLPAGDARAEIAIEDSVEWLCARADRVFTGRIKTVEAIDPAQRGDAPRAKVAAGAQGKDQGLVLLLVQGGEAIKGAAAAESCVGLRNVGAAPFERHAAQGTELIFFLSESVQARAYKGRQCNLWPLRGGGDPWIVAAPAPGRRMLSAATFQVLGDRAAILPVCKGAARGKTARDEDLGLLEIPFETPAHEAVCGHSACYLNVPRPLFPKARASLR